MEKRRPADPEKELPRHGLKGLLFCHGCDAGTSFGTGSQIFIKCTRSDRLHTTNDECDLEPVGSDDVRLFIKERISMAERLVRKNG